LLTAFFPLLVRYPLPSSADQNTVRPKPHFIRTDLLDSSAIQGLYSQDITQYLRVTKYTIQKYLEACLHPDGQFHHVFERFAKFSAQYTVNESLSQDPQVRSIQISRYFSRMSENPPQIIIQDGGYEYQPASLGSLTAGWNTCTKEGIQIIRIMDVVKIPITITCAATDEQSIEDLTAIMTMAFGQFQKMTCNYILCPPVNQQRVYWEVRIPLKHRIDVKSHAALHGDPTNQLWQVNCNLEVEFENSTYLQYSAAPRFESQQGTMAVAVPSRIPLARETVFSIAQMPYPVFCYSNDSRIALVRPTGTQFTIRPKRLGTFKLLVCQGPVSTGVTLPGKNPILAEKEITVVVR
jgi:hypothetical protein